MAGPHSPNHTSAAHGGPTDIVPTRIPATRVPRDPSRCPGFAPAPQAGPPPAIIRAACRRRSRTRSPAQRRLIVGVVLAIVLVAVLTVAIVYGVRTNGANTGTTFSEGDGENGDPGLPGRARAPRHRRDRPQRAVRHLRRRADQRSDQALAKLSSDAFRKQFSEVELTSIDKIVYLSQYQAQALFTMRVSAGERRPDARAGAGHRAAAVPARPDHGVLVRAAHRRLVLVNREPADGPADGLQSPIS